MKKKKPSEKRSVKRLGIEIWKARQIYLMIIPIAINVFLFDYRPLTWLRAAFYDFSMYHGFEGSEFIGFANFIKLFETRNFWQMLWNAVALNLWELALAFPAPIIFALILNEMRSNKAKTLVQTVSFLPHFISTVAVVAIVTEVFSPSMGIVGKLMRFFGMEPIYFMARKEYFRPLMVLSSIWQGMGWSSIIYSAALSSIDPNLHEAAVLDGASRWQRLLNVTLPAITPLIVTMLVLKIGGLISTGTEKVLLMQTSTNMGHSEVLSTFLYKQGVLKMKYSFSVATGIFNGLVGFMLVSIGNMLNKKLTDSEGLW